MSSLEERERESNLFEAPTVKSGLRTPMLQSGALLRNFARVLAPFHNGASRNFRIRD